MKEEDLIKCYSCNKNLLQEKVIEGKLVKMLHPERRITQFYLNNGSRMDVAVCLDCNNMDLNNPIMQNKVMKNIIDGWQIEQDILLSKGQVQKWQCDLTMEYHRGLSILFKSEGMDDYQVKKRSTR